MTDSCVNCNNPLGGHHQGDLERYHRTMGHAAMWTTGLRVTATDGERVAPRLEGIMRMVNSTHATIVHQLAGDVSWIFLADAPKAEKEAGRIAMVRRSIEALAPSVGLQIAEHESPGANEVACSKSCRIAFFQRETRADTRNTVFKDDAHTRQILASKAENQCHPERDATLHFDCSACGAHTSCAPERRDEWLIVRPFRAVIGSRTPQATSAALSISDARSAVFVGSATSTSGTIGFSNNGSGNARWDLVYAVVAVDANGASATRYQKNSATKAVSAFTAVTTLVTSVSLAVAQGTPDPTTPLLPSTPVDSGTTYYIPLAFVRIPNGFVAGASPVHVSDILIAMPVFPIFRTNGTQSCQPASSCSTTTLTTPVLTTARIGTWGTSGVRPACYLPQDMIGGDSLLVALDLSDASSSNWSHQSLTIVDSSRDWRGRIWRWAVHCGSGGFQWDPSVSSASRGVPSAGGTFGSTTSVGFGQSFNPQVVGSLPASAAAVCWVTPNVLSNMVAATDLAIYCDMASGFLKVAVTGTPLRRFFIRLDSSAPFSAQA